MNHQFMRQASFAVVMLVCAGAAAAAGSQTANLAVNASVVANCTIATTPVAFGTYDTVAGTAVNATGAVSIACTKGAGPSVTLGLGANASGAVRRMSGGGAFLTYELYQQPTTTPGAACDYTAPTVWGLTGSNIFTPAAAPSKDARSYNVCGQIAASQDVPAANYSDLVVATVNF